MPRLTKIYTKRGDAGDTALGGGQRVPKDHPRVHLVTDAPIMELSSTRVREEFASGRYPVGAVAPEVIQYIREQALYRD